MIGQQLYGINVLIQFPTTLFISADPENSKSKALWISWVIGAINVVCGLPVLWLIDRAGRRDLLLFLAPHLAWTILVAGNGHLILVDNEGRLPLITLFSLLFVALYSSSQGKWVHEPEPEMLLKLVLILSGPVPFCDSAEAQPITHREVGASFAVAMNLFWLAKPLFPLSSLPLPSPFPVSLLNSYQVFSHSSTHLSIVTGAGPRF